MIVFVLHFSLAMYPAILFLIFLLDRVLPRAFLFSSNVFPNDSLDCSSNCLDVLFTSVGLILPMSRDASFGL